MTMQDVRSSMVAVFQLSIIFLAVIATATALGNMSYFGNSFAFAQAQAALAMMDYVGLFLTTGFFIVSVGLAALSRNNRVFLPISLIALVVDVLLAAIFADVWHVLIDTSFLGGAANTLPITNLIATNFPLVIGVMGLTVILALYTELGGARRAPR